MYTRHPLYLCNHPTSHAISPDIDITNRPLTFTIPRCSERVSSKLVSLDLVSARNSRNSSRIIYAMDLSIRLLQYHDNLTKRRVSRHNNHIFVLDPIFGSWAYFLHVNFSAKMIFQHYSIISYFRRYRLRLR